MHSLTAHNITSLKASKNLSYVLAVWCQNMSKLHQNGISAGHIAASQSAVHGPYNLQMVPRTPWGPPWPGRHMYNTTVLTIFLLARWSPSASRLLADRILPLHVHLDLLGYDCILLTHALFALLSAVPSFPLSVERCHGTYE